MWNGELETLHSAFALPHSAFETPHSDLVCIFHQISLNIYTNFKVVRNGQLIYAT